MNTKRGFAGVAIIMALIVAVIAGGAYVVIKNGQSDGPYPVSSIDFTPPNTEPVVSEEKLTASKILNSNGFVDGKKSYCEDPQSGATTPCSASKSLNNIEQTIDKVGIVFGDVDGDGSNEAVAGVTTCISTCGSDVYVFKLVNGDNKMAKLPGASLVSTMGKVTSINISNGIISVRAPFDGVDSTYSYRASLLNTVFTAEKI